MAKKRGSRQPGIELVQIWPTFLGDQPAPTERFSFLCEARVCTTGLGTWLVRFRVRVVDRQLFISEFQLDPDPTVGTWPSDRVSHRLLSAIPLDALLMDVRVWMETDGRPMGDAAQTEALAQSVHFLEWQSSRPHFVTALQTVRAQGRGRPRLRTDEELREVAEAAVALGQELGRGWQQELARRRGELHEDGITVRQPLKDAIRMCRTEVEYLAPTTRGSQTPPQPGHRLLALWKRERDPRYAEWMTRLHTIDEEDL